MNRRRRGAAFLLALAAMVVLTGGLVALAATQRASLTAMIHRHERARARRAAMSAVQYAVATLADERTAGGTAAPAGGTTGGTQTPGSVTTLQDPWATFGETGATRFTLDRASFRVQIVDADSLLNLNTITEAELQRLPLTQTQISSLLDFRSANLDARPDGAKDQYYNGLERPYNTPLRRFETVDELLLVREWTPDTLYRPQTNVSSTGGVAITQDGETPLLADLFVANGYSPTTTPDGGVRINVNSLNGQPGRLTAVGFPQPIAQAIAARNNWTSLGEIVRIVGQDANLRGIVLDRLVVGGGSRIEGRVNLNTAREAVLQVLGLQPDAVQAVLGRQGTGFTRLSEFATLPGIDAETLTTVADRITVSSDTFIVRTEGVSGASRVSLEAVVDVVDGRFRILQMNDVPFDDMATRWGWPDETTTEQAVEGFAR